MISQAELEDIMYVAVLRIMEASRLSSKEIAELLRNKDEFVNKVLGSKLMKSSPRMIPGLTRNLDGKRPKIFGAPAPEGTKLEALLKPMWQCAGDPVRQSLLQEVMGYPVVQCTPHGLAFELSLTEMAHAHNCTLWVTSNLRPRQEPHYMMIDNNDKHGIYKDRYERVQK